MVKYADIEKNAGKNVLYQSNGDDIFDSDAKEFTIKSSSAGFKFETTGNFTDSESNGETTTSLKQTVNTKFALEHLLPKPLRVSPLNTIDIKKFKMKACGAIDLEAACDSLVKGLTTKFVSKTSCNFASPFDAFTLKNDYKKDDVYVHSAIDLKDFKVSKVKAGVAYQAGDLAAGAEATLKDDFELTDLSVKAGYSLGDLNAAAILSGLTTKPSYKAQATYTLNDKANFGAEANSNGDFGVGASYQIDGASKVHAKANFPAGDVHLYYSNAVCGGLDVSVTTKFDTKAGGDSADAFKYGFGLTFTA